MKLYIIPKSSSLAPHILLHELEIPHQLVVVDRETKKNNTNQNYLDIVSQGYVPALQLDNGEILTEVVAILQYLADTHPEKGLAPACGTFERARLQQWLNFTATELHKRLRPILRPHIPAEEKQTAIKEILQRLGVVEKQLETTSYILDENFSIADIYLYTTISRLKQSKLDLSAFPKILQFIDKISKRAAVKEAMRDEVSAMKN